MRGGLGLTEVTKVKGHATAEMVVSGQVRAVIMRLTMRLIVEGGGSLWEVLTPRRSFAGLCCLNLFFIAIARVAVNEDESGGIAINPVFGGAVPKEKKARVEVRNCAFLRGPAPFGMDPRAPNSSVGEEDGAAWPYSVPCGALCIGLPMVRILGLEGCPTLSFSSSTSFGLVNVSSVRNTFPG